LFSTPAHPYTHALLQAVPERSRGARRLNTLGGMVPGQHDRPQGCLLEPRCPSRQEKCRTQQPLLTGASAAQVRCFYPMNVEASV
jgi:dipeptide transport system ATP-binding protein